MSFPQLKRRGFRGPLHNIMDGAVFWLPLKSDVRDLVTGEHGTFTRASDGIYLRGGTYQIAASNVPRFEAGGMLLEPSRTNKNTNYNANPDVSLTNVVGAGGTVTRESAAGAIAAAGLDLICTDGNVVQIHNPTGGTIAAYIYGGTGGVANPHTASLWANTFGDAIGLTISGTASSTTMQSNALERFSYTDTPDTSNRVLMMQIGAGETLQFVLNQLEELAVVSSPIVVAGSTASGAVEQLRWDTLPAGVDMSQGTICADWTPLFSAAECGNNKGILTFTGSAYGPMYLGVAGPDGLFKTFDGTTAASLAFDGSGGPSNGQEYRLCVRWSGSTAHCGIKTGGSWMWRPTTYSYDGAWDFGGIADELKICHGIDNPQLIKNLRIWNRDFGQAETTRLL